MNDAAWIFCSVLIACLFSAGLVGYKIRDTAADAALADIADGKKKAIRIDTPEGPRYFLVDAAEPKSGETEHAWQEVSP